MMGMQRAMILLQREQRKMRREKKAGCPLCWEGTLRLPPKTTALLQNRRIHWKGPTTAPSAPQPQIQQQQQAKATTRRSQNESAGSTNAVNAATANPAPSFTRTPPSSRRGNRRASGTRRGTCTSGNCKCWDSRLPVTEVGIIAEGRLSITRAFCRSCCRGIRRGRGG